jgi:hypothetical protein
MSEDLKLIYVTKIGETHNDEFVYEFIFSEAADDAIGEGWEEICAYSVHPPQKEFIDKVITLHTKDFELSLLEEQENFRYLDGVLGVISLAWEFVDDYALRPSLNEPLLVFGYGDPIEDVVSQFKDKGLTYKM